MPGSETSRSNLFFYTYVIESLENATRLYIGSTNNLIKRLDEHNKGKNISTKPYLPWRLIYYEACRNREDAERREKYLKTSQGMRLLKRRMKEYLYLKNKNT